MGHKAAIAGLVLAAGTWLAGSGAWLAAKAAVAQVLLQHAWEQTLRSGEPHRTWPWADTRPLARLRAPALGVSRIILDGGSGRTLAFGPGHVPGTSIPGDAGPSVVSAHRDSHFRFLVRLRAGDLLQVERPDAVHRYRVAQALVVDLADGAPTVDPARDLLILVTCFPFDDWSAGGSRRYLVVAPRETPEAARPLTRLSQLEG